MGLAMTSDYTDISQLAGVYLEDSFVIGIAESGPALTFTLDAVLTPAHPAFQKPRPGEQYCYSAAALTFLDIVDIEWVRRSAVRSVDADGLADLGNIDSLTHSGDTYHVAGDWGDVTFRTAREPLFEIDHSA